MQRFFGIILFLALILTTLAAQSAAIVVFAAASLTDCLNQIASQYERQTGERVLFNFGASSLLARQIEEGAPADVFLSADEARMNALEKKGLIFPATRKSLLSNLLVIIVPADRLLAIRSPEDLTNAAIRRVALADPQAVPAGVYAKEYLQKLGLWSRVEPKVVPADNVRAALAAVESGNVEAGIVYKTDAAMSAKVKVAYCVPKDQGPDISYPMAVIRESRHLGQAEKFLKYLDSSEAAGMFDKFGFIVRR